MVCDEGVVLAIVSVDYAWICECFIQDRPVNAGCCKGAGQERKERWEEQEEGAVHGVGLGRVAAIARGE